MLPHHKTTICDGKGINRKFKHVLKEFKDAMMEAQGKPIIFVTIFGSYQIGKSSTLKLLTGDKSIAVGNGRDEETTGAFIYGPLPYNDFRKKFGMEIIPNNETQIFFIDTEGSDGFNAVDGFNAGDGQIQAGHYLMSQLIYPYAALSSVIISMLETNFSNGVADTIKEILKTIDLIIRGTLKSDLSKNLIALVRNVPKYQPSKGKFDKYQKKIKKSIYRKIQNTIQYNDFIPLYPIDINADIMAQGFEFNLGFKIFAQRLINHIEEARKEFTFDWESACEMFENLINLPEQQDIIQVIIQIFQDTQNKNYENKYKPIVEEIIQKKIQELDNKINEIESSIKEGTIIELPIIDSVKIIKELTEDFDSKIEEGKVKDSNVYKELKRKISDEISTKCKIFNELRDQMKQLQHKHLQDEINSYIETKKKQSEQTMTNSKSSDLGELLRSCSLDSDDCINELNRIGSEEKIDFSIIMEIQENINTEIHQINDEIKQEAKKVRKNTERNTQ
ncbi:uncharacterized protein GO595_009848 [Histomonas meleagridis]|uniref:uncharacterized protein n=1 Tax=Histomonas meleagridis TaxID=135588 RepID=UPI003559C9AA|nr:hypothetical protein GO595_009848 [Histomonas meleagridis]